MGIIHIYMMRFLRIPTIYVLSRNMKISGFLSECFSFLVVKFSIYFNTHVFVMKSRHIFAKGHVLGILLKSSVTGTESYPQFVGHFI